MTALFDQYGHPVQALVDPSRPGELFDQYGRPRIVLEDYTGLDLAAASAISIIARRGIWTSGLAYNGFTVVKTGSGNAWGHFGYCAVSTGATAGSKAVVYGGVLNNIGNLVWEVNWDKALIIAFLLAAFNSDPQAVRRWQYKAQAAPDEAQLADMGIGTELQNLALYAESFGAQRGVLDLDTTLVVNQSVEIVLVHTPGQKQEWYVNGALKATQADLSRIPSGRAYSSQVVQSAINGAAGGVDCQQHFGGFQLWTQR